MPPNRPQDYNTPGDAGSGLKPGLSPPPNGSQAPAAAGGSVPAPPPGPGGAPGNLIEIEPSAISDIQGAEFAPFKQQLQQSLATITVEERALLRQLMARPEVAQLVAKLLGPEFIDLVSRGIQRAHENADNGLPGGGPAPAGPGDLSAGPSPALAPASPAPPAPSAGQPGTGTPFQRI